METRANFVLIGAFTLLGILGSLGFFVWLASVQIDRRYDVYGILFDDVTGLDQSGDVLFNGIPVGRVIGLQIYAPDPGRVLATVEVDATTPIRQNTVAQLTFQGVTGVAYIALSGGRGEAPPLIAPDSELPIIPSRRSTVQALAEEAPALLARASELIEQLQALISEENRAHVAGILRNLETSSAQLDQALRDVSGLTGTLVRASDQIAGFTERLDGIGTSVTATLANMDSTLAAVTGAFDEARRTLDAAGPVIRQAGTAFESAATLMRDRVPGLVDQVARTVTTLETAVAEIAEGSASALQGFTQTADLLNARLAELEGTLAAAGRAFAAVTEASNSLTALTQGDGAGLVADSRDLVARVKEAVGTIQTTVDRDLPTIMADIRSAVTTASGAMDRVAADVTAFAEGLAPLMGDAQLAIQNATQVFDRAKGTMTVLENTLGTADAAMAAAATAFESATGLMDTDLAPVLEDIRSAAASIDRAAAQFSTDLPAITSDLSALIARADAVVAEVQTTVKVAAPGVRDFAGRGLPELARLGTEVRGLVRTLNDAVRRLQQNPAGFLSGNRVPEYRR
ncbi:MlaD family protein [Paracoccus niistensis]|uniref:MlaD family protein n=1 Tax=Paracoccus niistensis TaxID=632935 RepID=A0ABV6I0J6_9RHOB